MRQVQTVHLRGYVEAAGVFDTVVVVEVGFTPQRVQAMHLVERVHAAEVAVIPQAPAGRDLDGLGWVFSDCKCLLAGEADRPCVV